MVDRGPLSDEQRSRQETFKKVIKSLQLLVFLIWSNPTQMTSKKCPLFSEEACLV